MNKIRISPKLVDLNAIIVFSLLFLTFIIALPHYGHDADTFCWKEWCRYIFQNGLTNVYNSWTDYLPLYHYILYIFGKFQGSLEHIDQNIYYLKTITLFFDFICGIIIYTILKRKYNDQFKAIVFSLFYFFNIAYFYNTLIWGQVDGIMACFIILSFFFALKNKVALSLLFFLLGLNMKLQAIIFLPVIGLIILPSLKYHFSLKNLFKWVGVLVIAQGIILLPFILSGSLNKLWNVVTGSIDKYPVVSMNAYNFWLFFFPNDFFTTNDTLKFMGLTLKFIGLILFFAFSFLALFPLIKFTFKKLFLNDSSNIQQSKLLIISSLIALIFFFFNTQMHERYSHVAILFLAISALTYNRYLSYIIGSIAYFLNMEDVLKYLHLHNYSTVIFTGWVISIIYLITILILFCDLYKKDNKAVPSYIE